MSNIPLSVPSLMGREWEYVKECIDTEWVSSAGKYVELFEEKIAEYTGANYAVACVNGTAALQVSLRLAGVEPNDDVIIPTLTFIAPVNAIVYNGANPVFMDADNYYNIDIEKTIDFINKETFFKNGFTYNRSTNNRISAIIPVHIWGNAVWQDTLEEICEDRNIAIVEDASESLGTFYSAGKYKDHHSGTIGKLGCVSFNGNKIITTGGGGMILTQDKQLSEKARYLTTQCKDDAVRYIHNEIGYNFRMTNIQAALGVAQLEQLPKFLKRKRHIYLQYQDALKSVAGLSIAPVPDYAENNHWINLLQIDSEIYGEDRESLMERLANNGIQTRPVWGLNHLQIPYQNCQTYQVTASERLVGSSLCIPSSTNLTDENIKKVVSHLNG
jgi:perosamine synthetase